MSSPTPLVLDVTRENLALWAEQTQQLEADFPAWVFRHGLPDVTLHDWEARRRENSLPVEGGVSWIVAGSAERLRELIEAAQRIETGR